MLAAILAQLQADPTTTGGLVALASVHLHTWWQTTTLRRHIDGEISRHVKERHQ
jgi:hypothetical protein